MAETPESKLDPEKAAQQVAQTYYGAAPGEKASRRMVRRFLFSALCAAILTPLVFYLKSGEVGPLGWGLTVFLVVFSLLSAVGFFFLNRPAYHTPVAAKGDWLDRLGAFWLVACAFGPLIGWFITASALPLTPASWRWQYAVGVIFSIGLPVVTALPLLRYVRGKGAAVALTLLLGVTTLPVLTGVAPLLDLRDGPVSRQVGLYDSAPACRTLDGAPLDVACAAQDWGQPGEVVVVTMLRHTHRVLGVGRKT